jgi:hypothetical protein
MTQEIRLFGIGQQSKSTNITAAHRLNVYYDIQTDADKAQVVAYGTPGLDLFSTISSSPTRGMHWMESFNTLYVVQRGDLWAVANDGTPTLKKSLTAANPTDIAGRVSMANNGTQLCIVTGAFGYIYNPQTDTLTDITASLPAGGSDTVTFLDSYFIVNRVATGQFYLSNSYDGLTWNGLNFATAESNPDNLVTCIADKGYLVLFGTSSTEIWLNSGNVLFAFQRIDGAPSQAGLAARWTLSKCGDYLTGLFINKYGVLVIGRLNGYIIEPVSTPDIDYLINNYTSPTDAEGFAYSLNGRHFYQITFITQGVTWLYDTMSNAWSQLKSWNIPRHLASVGCSYNTSFIVSDYSNGNLYSINADNDTDNGQRIERELISGHVFVASRNKQVINRIRLDMEGGVGTTINPTIMLSISRDGGHTYGMEMWTTIGRLSEFMMRAEWRRLGQARDFVLKIRMTDQVKFVLIAAVAEGKELNK